MDNDKKSVIDKIAKLLRLAERAGTPGEAAAAAAQAQRMMQKYKIAQAEVAADSGTPDEKVHEYSGLFATGPRMPTWVVFLARSVARSVDCRTFTRWWYGDTFPRRRERSVISLVGRPSDIAVAQYMFKYLHREIERLTQEALATGAIYGRTGSVNFRLGAVYAIQEKLKASKAEVRAEATSTALVKLDSDNAAVEAYMRAMKLKKGRVARISADDEARALGHEAGSSIAVRPGVDGNKPNKQLS